MIQRLSRRSPESGPVPVPARLDSVPDVRSGVGTRRFLWLPIPRVGEVCSQPLPESAFDGVPSPRSRSSLPSVGLPGHSRAACFGGPLEPDCVGGHLRCAEPPTLDRSMLSGWTVDLQRARRDLARRIRRLREAAGDGDLEAARQVTVRPWPARRWPSGAPHQAGRAPTQARCAVPSVEPADDAGGRVRGDYAGEIERIAWVRARRSMR